ncbi:MAG: FAD-binding oxidoreductase [Anaerolineales bacterium]
MTDRMQATNVDTNRTATSVKGRGALNDRHIRELVSIVGAERVSRRESDLTAHSADESWADPALADVVVWPLSTEEIARILCYANEEGIPVVPWSGGSSLEGNPIPVQGGILLALYRMDEIVKVREADLQVVVQPGVVYDDLNAELRRLGLFFPPAPGSSDVATIGGMVANNSSGMRSVRYGVTRRYVLKLKAVLPDGRVIVVGSNAKKSTSGYDLIGLFTGSEGTLGVVTEITLRVTGLPESVAAAVIPFDTLSEATSAVYECARYGLEASAIELLDAPAIRVTNAQQGLSLLEKPTVFVEFHGAEAHVQDQVEYLREIAHDNGCLDFQLATDYASRQELWSAREAAHDSMKMSHPGCTMIAGDACVPISKFGDVVQFAHDLAEETDVTIYVFGHAGDGNLHTEAIGYRDDEEQFARAVEATDAIVARALQVGGTVAGEHGIGLMKRHFMSQEHGQSLEVMRSIKDLFDPKGIMNPGKVFPG